MTAVSVIRETRDDFGDVVATTTIPIGDVIVAPRESTEPDRGRAAVVTGVTLYCPDGTVILPTDVVAVDGLPGRWQVDGDSFNWAHPFADWRPGVEVRLVRTRG